MSAIELADKFDWSKTTYEIHTWCLEAQSMLRQQQAEIEALKAHPLKELTDEEIEECIYHVDDCGIGLFDFARAILRKAQEK